MTNATPTITDQVGEFLAARGPAPTAPSTASESAEDREARLVAQNVPGTAEVGSALPEAVMLDVHGDERSLAQALDSKPAVIVFYRGNWCPFCNIALRTYQEQLQPRLSESGVSLVAISPQTPDNSLSAEEKYSMAFTVLSDPANSLARSLGVLMPMEEELPEQYRAAREDANADSTAEIPFPTTIIVDATGTIRFIDSRADYTTRTEVATILTELDKAGI